MDERYLDVEESAGAAFFSRPIQGPIVMLNLLKFRDVADYSRSPDLAPSGEITGREAYDRYMAHTAPFLAASGGQVIFFGAAGDFLIGPDAETWDVVMLVRQASQQTFLAFATDPEYLAGAGHRTAALLDSRLLPITEGRAANAG